LITLFSLFILSIQILFWITTGLLKRDFFRQKNNLSKQLVPFSVIISARNEARNIVEFLPSILNQDYPTFEIIVIDDDSRDNSLEMLHHFKDEYPFLRIIEIKNKKHPGKKYGLQEAIHAASYEWLVFTDADCYPQSNQWLHSIAAKFKNGIDIVLGYSPYRRTNGYLNDFIRYETFLTAVIYGTFTLKGMPYMGVGRNMAYRKSKFIERVDKEKFEKISFGDDDLAVNAMANHSNTAIQFDASSRVISIPSTTFREFIHQKTRHISVSTHYRGRHQMVLGVLALSQAFFYPVCFLMLFIHFKLALLLFIFRITLFLMNILPLMSKMEVKDLRKKVMVLDFLFFLYYWYMSIRWIGSKNISWTKG
jgi:glycosyltransferase involved in cell wall biosynthesis